MQPKRETVFLYFATCIVNLSSFYAGTAFAWSSPIIPRLDGTKEPENNPLDHNITSTEKSLIASLYILGAALGPFVSAFVAFRIGRRNTIALFMLPAIASCIMKAFATKVSVLYAARILGGFASSTTTTEVPLFVAEIAESHNRGALSVLAGISVTVGTLFTYSLGSYASIKWTSLSGLVAPIIVIIVLPVFIPESPYYWLSKDNKEEALKTLNRLRGGSQREIADELNDIQTALNFKNTAIFRDLLSTRASKVSLYTTITLICLQQFTGLYAIQLYLHSIFQKAGSSFDAERATIIIGGVKLAADLITIFAIDRVGRRFLLMQSGIGVTLALTTLGTYFYAKDKGYDLTALDWLPITCIVIYMLTVISGIARVPLVLIGELFPQHMKRMACVFVITIASFVSFMVIFIFPNVNDTIGLGPSFWIFAAGGVLVVVYTWFMVPETKEKTLQEVQLILEKM